VKDVVVDSVGDSDEEPVIEFECEREPLMEM